ncbi:hypothetical protein PYW07_010724 [Mythimna separata]|uniref:EGF-like domain-containing protein n=1 Tax=Mythimna separata TaxID=271217 RepID=A0AAD8DL27_MYTSE|nr:hypothetical protein PYW07_010724 [Mythimna separata]
MYIMQSVWVLIVLFIGLAHSLTWDIVVARSNKLEFYNEGILVYTATPAAHRINWISYDPVHNRILFADQNNKINSASSFDIATKKTQSLIKKIGNRYLTRFAYDPANELLFGTDKNKLYSFSMRQACNNEVNGNLVIDFEKIVLREVAVDSCRGYIYWIANDIIERARIDGSERETIIEADGMVKQGLTIGTDKIYWIESHDYNNGAFSIESANLNGHYRRTLYSARDLNSTANALTVSNGFISWGNSIENFFWQLPKNSPNGTEPNKILMTTTLPSCGSQDIAAYYKISNCHSTSKDDDDDDVNDTYCVNGKKLSGDGDCYCLPGYIGERCDVSVCHNYCLQGDCSLNADREPNCRCNAGYSGERCEVYACSNYCAHNGVCSLNDNNEPVCQCKEPYWGERCAVRHKGYHWLPMKDGQLPPNAIIGGYDNEELYIARAYVTGSLCPGKYVKSVGKAFIPFGGNEHIKEEDFEILCGYTNANATWFKVDSKYIPENAFIGGRTGGDLEIRGEALYVCKAEVETGKVVTGKGYGRTYLCYLPNKGQEITASSFEVLVVPDNDV